jgi:hypothetical protein
MRTPPLHLLAVASVAAGLAAAAPAGAAAQRCNELRGTTKVDDGRIKVVEKKVNDRRLKGRRAFGCSLPRGRVYTVGERGTPKNRPGDPNSVFYELGQRAGRQLEVRRTFGDGIAQIQSIRASVMDLSDGSNRTFFRGEFGESLCAGTEGTSSSDTPPVRRLVLEPAGGFAVLYGNTRPEDDDCFPTDGRALLVGFGASGSRVTLDFAPLADIAPESVAIAGGTVSWTNAGQPRSEDIGS